MTSYEFMGFVVLFALLILNALLMYLLNEGHIRRLYAKIKRIVLRKKK